MLLVFFDLGFLQTFRRVFDTDKLAFTELLGVPNAIRGVYLNDMAPPHEFLPRYLTQIDSISGLYFL